MNSAPAAMHPLTCSTVRTVPAPTRVTPSATSWAMTSIALGTVKVTSIAATEVPASPRANVSAWLASAVRMTANDTARDIGAHACSALR